MADGMNEHREIAVIESQPSRGTWVLAVGTLWGCWLVSIYPVVQLFLEFGQRQIEDCGAEWWYHAWSYPHFFIYPVTFGLVSTVFLHRPWIRVVHYLFSLTRRGKINHFVFILFSMLVVVAFMTVVEFIRAPQGSAAVKCDGKLTEPTRSLWDIAPDAMKGNEVHALVARQCKKGKPLEKEEKCEYGRKMAELWDDSRESSTVGAYRWGFVFMTFLFVFLFAAIAIVRSWKPEIGSHPEGKRIAGMLFVALSFATMWVFLRAVYLWVKKPLLYPEDPQLAFDILILGIFLIFLLYAAICRWSRVARYESGLRRYIICILFGSFGVTFIQQSPTFGMRDSVLIALAYILFVFASLFPVFLKKLDGGIIRTIVFFFSSKWLIDWFLRKVQDDEDV